VTEHEDHDVDCVECLAHLYEYVDGELTPELAEAISTHIADCGDCLPQFKFERAFLAFLEARPELAKAPPALRDQILRRILSQRGPAT
jgi:anti-sigma factor (TIGR02949 family)